MGVQLLIAFVAVYATLTGSVISLQPCSLLSSSLATAEGNPCSVTSKIGIANVSVSSLELQGQPQGASPVGVDFGASGSLRLAAGECCLGSEQLAYKL